MVIAFPHGPKITVFLSLYALWASTIMGHVCNCHSVWKSQLEVSQSCQYTSQQENLQADCFLFRYNNTRIENCCSYKLLSDIIMLFILLYNLSIKMCVYTNVTYLYMCIYVCVYKHYILLHILIYIKIKTKKIKLIISIKHMQNEVLFNNYRWWNLRILKDCERFTASDQITLLITAVKSTQWRLLFPLSRNSPTPL